MTQVAGRSIEIRVDDLTSQEVSDFLQAHMDDMQSTSPPESVHALDLEALKQLDVTFWTVWDGNALLGCGALKELDQQHAEIKSMRTSEAARGKGVASMLLTHLLKISRERAYRLVSLETGSMDYFEPARRLYQKFGFECCGPFADYVCDPNSVFMSLDI
ncbi:MAG: GNAT family N-acetyltransferase [Pseudomonadales bacterium]